MTILLPHLRQPAQWAPVNRGHPLAAGMVELVAPHHLRSAVSGKPQMTGGGTGTRTWRAGRFGVYRWLERTAVLEDRYPQDRGVSGDLTLFMVGGTDGAMAATQRLLLLQTAGGTRRAAMGEEGTSKFAFNTNPSGGSAVDAIESTTTLGEDHVYVGRLSGTTQTLWVDGASVASAAQSGSNFSDIGSMSLNTTGFLSGGSGRIYLCGWAARAWTDLEIQEFARNPWALFEPPRIFVAGASGGTSHDGAAAESVTASDAPATTAAFGGAGAESVSPSDAQTGAATWAAGVSESVAVSDSATGTTGGATYNDGASESVSATDAPSATAQVVASTAEAVSAAESAGAAAGYAAAQQESFSAADTADATLPAVHAGAVSEAVALVDTPATPSDTAAGGIIIRPRKRYVVRNGRDLLVYDDEASARAAHASIRAAEDAASAAIATATRTSKRAARRARATVRADVAHTIAATTPPAESVNIDHIRAMAQQYARAAALREALLAADLSAAIAMWHDMLDEEDAEILLMAA